MSGGIYKTWKGQVKQIQKTVTVHKVCLKTSVHYNLGGFTHDSSRRNEDFISDEVSKFSGGVAEIRPMNKI